MLLAVEEGLLLRGGGKGEKKWSNREPELCAIRLPHDLTRLEHFVPKKKKISLIVASIVSNHS